MKPPEKGIPRRARLGPLAALACALAGAGPLAAGAVAPAAAAESSVEEARPAPPSAAEVAQRTQWFLRSAHDGRPVERADRATPRRPPPHRDGGIGPDGKPTGREGELFGEDIHIALYGAPQLTGTAVGKRSPAGAARKLKHQAKAYRKHGDRRVQRAIDLIGVIATSSPGADGLYRSRQSDAVISSYLSAARSVGARLVLDVQPGRSSVLREVKALRPWPRRPDVDVAIDPEWNVGPRGVPGRTEGSIRARELNRVTELADSFVAARELPPKALIVHQFREESVRGRGKLEQGEAVEVLLNFDGIGTAKAKRAGYENLAVPGTFDGFSLFYDLDVRLMRPPDVLALRPEVDFAMYQ